jgi:hypothetical protein
MGLKCDQVAKLTLIPKPSSDPSSHFAAKIWTSVVWVYIFLIYPKVRVYINFQFTYPMGYYEIFFTH